MLICTSFSPTPSHPEWQSCLSNSIGKALMHSRQNMQWESTGPIVVVDTQWWWAWVSLLTDKYQSHATLSVCNKSLDCYGKNKIDKCDNYGYVHYEYPKEGLRRWECLMVHKEGPGLGDLNQPIDSCCAFWVVDGWDRYWYSWRWWCLGVWDRCSTMFT